MREREREMMYRMVFLRIIFVCAEDSVSWEVTMLGSPSR